MPTTISTPARFSSVRTAFNAEGYGISTSFFAYRQGGGIVPATSEFNVIGAGTVGDPLRMSQFSGFTVPSPVQININSTTVDATFFGATQASAVFGVDADGFTYTGAYTTAQSFTQGPQWCIPANQASNYEIFATLIVGPLSFGTTGSWLPLSNDQYWRLTVGTQNEGSAQFNLSIRKIGTTTILTTATITLYASTGLTD